MASYSGKKDWRGCGDSKPSSSTTEKPNEAGPSSGGSPDWRGLPDSRPSPSGEAGKKGE